MVATISREELKEKIDRGDDFLLVETLAPEYFRHTHLPGAINLPPDRVRELAPKLLPDKAAEIVVYCANLPCQNSEIAADRLTELGYTNVQEYAEGKQDWIDAGFPTENGLPARAA